ncbi:hypothetical protein RJ640_016426 [Escallonia rubra]|uniref:SWI/SNF complex subunit SWI3D n=1 Tax=Escallonia rubra TaxID=112253 RepID=A0AA88RSQ2_9ASTE|nr:hypothetical protein RJ640_016426 [Escallonia rubra]
MEEMRSDTGTVPPATSAVTETPTKVQADTAAAEPPSSRRRGGGQKRKAQSISGGNTFNNHSASASSKRQAREKLNTVPFPQIHHNGPCTRARQQPASFLDDAVVKSEVEALRLPESRGGEAVKAEEESIEDWEALEAKVEAQYDAIRSRDVNAHVVPIPAEFKLVSLSPAVGWFSWTKVHPLEERVLPSFFDGKSEKRSPEIYMEIRNWIMNRFHANLNTQIGVKDLSELSVGELDARQEVMEFLNYWGLINYHPFPSTDSAILSADVDKEASMGSLVEKLYRFEMEQSSAPVASKTNAAAPTVPSRLFPESAFAEDATRSEGPAVEYHCNSCSADCSRKRYHCQKQADYDLCTECFTSGKFDSDMSPSDFILMEPAEAAGASGGKWTDQETLLLLEALELFSENWNEIAEHVATKTKAQCILHFVQMPIEDTFLDCDEDMDTSIKNSADPDSTKDDASAPKDAPETTEPIDEVSDKPSSPSMEISKLVDASEAKKILEPEDVSEPKVNEEIGENCALKALREAFEAVGSLPLPEEQFSFAEAGNPVMALAAFLVRLGEPNTITASACTSVKSTLGNASGVQLAARHCFLLEEPRDDKNKPFNSERFVILIVA